MKKILLLLLLTFSTLSFGQLNKVEVSKPLQTTKVGPMGTFWCGADIYDEYVSISFQDMNYTQLTVIERFELTISDFKSLGELLTSNKNKEEDFYTLKTKDNKTLYILFGKSMGVVYPLISLDDSNIKKSKFPNLTKSQFKKLFNIK